MEKINVITKRNLTITLLIALIVIVILLLRENANINDKWETIVNTTQTSADYWHEEFIKLSYSVPDAITSDDEYTGAWLMEIIDNAISANLSVSLDSSGYSSGILSIYFGSK